MAPADSGGSWKVRCSMVVAQSLQRLQRKAARQGRGRKVLAAIRQIWQRMGNDPTSFGEPLYRLAALRMQIRQAIIRPLVVNFAVCEDQPLVYLKGVDLLPP